MVSVNECEGIKAYGIAVFVPASSKFEPANGGYEVEWYLDAVLKHNLEKLSIQQTDKGARFSTSFKFGHHSMSGASPDTPNFAPTSKICKCGLERDREDVIGGHTWTRNAHPRHY